MGGKSPCIRQIRLLKQLPNSCFSGCRVRIRWGQIYNFSRISKGFAVCFQRLIIFPLSLFFGAVTFLSEFCPRYVQDMYKETFLSVQVPSASFLGQKGRSQIKLRFSDLRFFRRKATDLSGNSSAFVGKLYDQSLIISKLHVPINKTNREIFVVTFLSENYNPLIIKAVEKSQLPDKYVGLDFPTKTEVSLSSRFPTKTEVSDDRGASLLLLWAHFVLEILLKIIT